MVSTVASRNMADVVGTKDITMMHSVVDFLGINSISGKVLDKAAAAVCGMAESQWTTPKEQKRIALTLFGFITEAAENVKRALEEMDYEVIPFHANGTGGLAMEALAAEGHFHGIFDLATHELADSLLGGYCALIGPGRLETATDRSVPRLVVPGGLDCAVLQFTRENVPERFRNRKIFFYDFRSGIRLNEKETRSLARQLAEKLNQKPSDTKVLIPWGGWSEADRPGAPLHDPQVSRAFYAELEQDLDPRIEIQEADVHINHPHFAEIAAALVQEIVGDRLPQKT
jgi:uncharacterized protein (UPF0261 family)